MKQFTSHSLAVLATFATFGASAEDSTPQRTSRWGLGLGAVASDNPYAGRGTRYSPVPLVTYDGGRLFFEGITAGVHVLDTRGLEIDLIAEANFDGIDAEDFGARELARNGIDRALLSDRDDSIDAGVDVSFSGRYGQLKFQALADVLDASGGYEVSASYGYPLSFGERWVVTPNIGVRWQSADRVDYYYGILDEEIARGVPGYRPGDVVTPEVGIDVRYRLATRWMLLGNLRYRSLPSELADSPLVDSDQSARMFIGVLRAF